MRQIAALACLVFGAAWLGCSTGSEAAPPPTGYELRKEAFFEETISSDSRNTYSEVMRLARGVAPDESKIQEDLDRMNQRLDTADFKLPAVLWMLYEHSSSDLLSQGIRDNAEDAIVAFKYWPDELETEADPVDTDDMVYWTENHFILFSTGAYLAGQLYPNEVFPASGETGSEKMATFRPRIMRWLELRYQTGFSEWLSNVYYDEDIPGLAALIEFADDQELKQLASIVLDVIFADESLDGPTPRYWVGYGTMPRAIQVKNVVISLYDVDTETVFYVTDQPLYTHAFLPKSKFDDAHKDDGWFFAREGDGYLALWSSDPDADWLENDEPENADLGDYEIIADGEKTIWICELGRASDYADFDAFKAAILSASLAVDAEALSVDYTSPSQGRLMMGWDGSITQDGAPLTVGDFPRYESPFGSSDFPGEVISFELARQRLKLDFVHRSREVSRFLD